MWKPMLPQLSETAPTGKEWSYEIKYDGFRCLLFWDQKGIKLISRNGNDLTSNFPEIITFFENYSEAIKDKLPLALDGELVILNNPYQGNFPLLQQRGRLKNEAKISAHAKQRPASIVCFDLLKLRGKTLSTKSYDVRRSELTDLFTSMTWPVEADTFTRIAFVQSFDNLNEIWNLMFLYYGEGIIAKRRLFGYEEGKRTNQWLKIKNWRVVSGVLTEYDPKNQYYTASVYNQNNLELLGTFKHGFNEEEEKTLRALIQEKGTKTKNSTYLLPPGICVDINCLHAENHDLREPNFNQFRFDLTPEECTTDKLKVDLAMLPDDVSISNPDKPLWPKPNFTKLDLLVYLRKISPYMLPFLKNKRLTLIRYPHGVLDQSFFQKHYPPNAPAFLDSVQGGEDETFIICNNMKSLVWLGNQGVLEFHIPFQKVATEFPDEIVFDLDPPSREHFQLAVTAAKLLKQICDHMGLFAFVKTSGNKGLQIHIPLAPEALTFEETRKFTEAVALLLVQHHPDLFTIERLKKNRGERLYIDYVQHAEGKTIITPYSPRATEEGTVSTPLFWSEVNNSLHPTNFTIKNVPNRIRELGCPFHDFNEKRAMQPIDKLKQLIN